MTTETRRLNTWQWWLTAAARLVVGAVFIVSGCTKMTDLWGFVYKINDYLDVWHMTVPQPLVLTGAGLLSTVEFLTGVALLLGCWRRLAVYSVTAMMAVMLPLTAYIAVANPVADCGCFGDWLVISNTMTFVKNLALTALTAWLWYGNRLMDSLVPQSIQWVSLTLSVLYMLVVGLTGYYIQPLLDFRPYPTGTLLTATGSDDDANDSDMVFIYEKDGQQQEFTIDTLPDDSWTFVDRKGDTAGSSEVTVYDTDDSEASLADIVDTDGLTMMVLIPEPRDTDPSMTFAINELKEAVDRAGGSTVSVIAAHSSKAIQAWRDFSLADYPIYTADDVDIKMVARGVVAIVMVKDGRIIWKRTLGSINPDVTDSTDDVAALLTDGLIPPGQATFWWLTGIFAALQLLTIALPRLRS